MDTKTKVEPLEWRKPIDHPQDDEYAICVAAGIGGRYAISQRQPVRRESPDKMGHLLWDAMDNFSFTEHLTVEEAKAAAQSDYEKRVLARLTVQP